MARRTREETKERSIFRELGGWLLYILIIIGLTYLIITFVGQRTRVSGSSMETTLSNGDNLIVDKLTYHFKEPKRYDIIVFPYKYEENTYYIKRIIGLPGETVQVIDGYTYINGEQLVGDIYENGMVMTGGGAMLHGLDKHMSAKLKMPVGLAENPVECVAIGTGRSFEYIGRLVDGFITSSPHKN